MDTFFFKPVIRDILITVFNIHCYDFSVESTALRLISGLGNAEVQPQLSRMFTEQNRTGFLSTESEELNRALVLTLARAVHVNGKEMKQH
jgi:mediator of RNA polymerase II transcription subunit 23